MGTGRQLTCIDRPSRIRLRQVQKQKLGCGRGLVRLWKMTWGLPQRMRSHCWQKRPKLNFFAHLWPISDFFYNSPNSTNTFFSNQTQDTFKCSRKSDTYLMFFKVTAVWTVMSSHPNFTSLRWDRRYNSASEEAGSGKIRCKQWMKPAWLTPLMELISWEKVRFWTQLDSS